jgi:succinate dehydrogenase / fumarate reductase iron-sulfur subunit
MWVRLKIWRQTGNASPSIAAYELEIDPGSTILDCLNQIKWHHDGTLAFRKNCRNTICGSCTMKINGRSALACKENVGHEVRRSGKLDSSQPPASNPCHDMPEITVAPMGNLPVIKDLVVDMQGFWNNLHAIKPYVSHVNQQVPEREFLQTPFERSKLDAMGNCILCGACYSECNAVQVNPQFVGPHALAKAQRLLADNRDTQTEERLEDYNNIKGVWGCTRCYYCNSVCPMDVAPMDQIGKIKQRILARHDDQVDSRAIRHRKVLVNLVKLGGGSMNDCLVFK